MEQTGVLKRIGGGLVTCGKVLSRVLFLLPIPLFMVWFSYKIDVSSLFKGEVDQYNLDIATAMVNGQAVDSYDRMDERAVLKELAGIIDEPYNTLSFGSSRVLQLRQAAAGKRPFFNGGVSLADFRDILGLTYLFDKEGMLPENIIIGVDPWIFGATTYDANPRSSSELYNEFLSVRLGIDSTYAPDAAPKRDRYLALLTPTYFQGNLQFWLTKITEGEGAGVDYRPPAIVTGDIYDQTNNIKLSDGSVLYMKSFREAPQATVDERAYEEHESALAWMNTSAKVDEELAGQFEAFVAYLRGKGVNVVFYLSPYNPVTYEYAVENPEECALVFGVEEYILDYAKTAGVPVYGSYNPYLCGAMPQDYFDGQHMKDEKMAEILPTMEKITAAEARGKAGSPWVTGKREVQYATAEDIITWKYAVGSEESLERMDDESVEGKSCYIIGRYGRPEGYDETAEPLLLARYAVAKTDGTAWRYDTDRDEWVVDYRYTGVA